MQRVEGEGERGQGGPGGEENGDDGEGDTAMVVGAEVDDHFAENPLLPLFFYFFSFISISRSFSWIYLRYLNILENSANICGASS